MSKRDFLAIDWGTTNRRMYRITNGVVADSERDGRGVTAIAPGGFEAEVAAIRARFGDLPILLAGMVGSTIGWRSVGYVECPVGLSAIAAQLDWIDARTAIVPGLSTVVDGRADVMRGEEVQLLGAVAVGLVPANALLCQPGTHCKWARIERGEVAGFTTAMTGELFALLRHHGLLAAQLGGTVTLGDAFHAGVAEGRRRDLLASLFGIRAAKLLGEREDADAASYASGLLIGADVAARVETGVAVDVLADPDLGSLYAAAIDACGGVSRIVDSQAAFVAGITAIGDLALEDAA